MALITAYWGLDGIIFLTTLIIPAYLYMTRKFNYWKKRDVSVALPPIPFLGNFADPLLLKKSPGNFLQELYIQGKESPYIGFYILDKPALLIRDRQLVKMVLVKDFNYFADRYASPNIVNDRLGSANLFLMKNPAWKILRTKLTPFFTSGKMKKIFELMLECGKDLDTYLESLKLGDQGKEMDIKELIAKFTTDIIGTVAYRLNVNSLNNPDAEFRRHDKLIFDFNFIHALAFLAMFFLPHIINITGITKTFAKESSIFLRKVFWETISQRVKSGGKRNYLIDTLIELRNTYGDQDMGGFSKQRIHEANA
ncbi:PREDICTED: cytochrome P450 6k1-like [Vollenhovia emeryi]|uniref:cytochrome P450 6k1-like n=1 Tax=Vollenhovia emeryi TaxID=411798 RepID=UPI0005F418DA|nr:PREDICTED: cytochrome P450 6k1-like [Vollenhovia emeryi]